MTNFGQHEPLINEFGEIIWNFQSDKVRQELRESKLGFFSGFHGTYVTLPASEQIAENAIRFARKHALPLKLGLEDKHELVNTFIQKRLQMSWAITPIECLPAQLHKLNLTPFQQAAALYAAHTRSCFIADTSADDRHSSALGAVHLVDGGPCILVCCEKDREKWEAQIRQVLPGGYTILNLKEVHQKPPKQSFLLAEYGQLERDTHFSQPEIEYHTLIIDHAEHIKNPDAHRTKRMVMLARNANYRFLLTDFPVNRSPADLREPLKLMRKTAEFSSLEKFLSVMTRDPLENREAFFCLKEYQDKLEQLYIQLRSHCMVRRANDPGLKIQRQVQGIQIGKIPEQIKMYSNMHPLHELGLKKVGSVIAWLQNFLRNQTGKTLVMAHHNDVVELLSSKLDLPTIYGPVGDAKRQTIWEDFFSPMGKQALVLASEIPLPSCLPTLSAVIFTELFTRPDDLSDLAKFALENDALQVIYLVSDNPLDRQALHRLMVRIDEARDVLDGKGDRDILTT